MVKPGRLVAGKLAGIGGAVAAIAIAGYIFYRTDAGNKILASIQGFGKNVGLGIVAPFSGIVQGVNLGGQGLATQLGDLNEALFNQGKIAQDQFNKLIHPDWYNADGSYSPSNPNYNRDTSSIGPPANPNPNNPPPNKTNPPGSTVIVFRDAGLKPTTPNVPTTGAINNRANIITTVKSTTSRPAVGTSSSVRDVRPTTLIRGQPVNSYLGNKIAQGVMVKSTVINTSAGGIREVAGSPALIARLQQNLRSTSR